jgi:ProP effector
MRAKNGAGSAAAETAGEARKIETTGECLVRSSSPLTASAQVPAAIGHKAKAAINTLPALRQNFPGAFARLDFPHRQPLKIGIRDDIIAQMPDHNPTDIGQALRIYVNGLAYLRACTENATRVDLDGNPAGTVNAKEAAHAQHLLARIKGRKHPTPQPAPPKKISLADLKAAAARKRNAMAGA